MTGAPLTVDYPAALDTAVTLGEIKNNAATTLSADCTSGDATLLVASTAGFPATGAVSIDNEIVYYTGKTGGGSPSFTGCSRGQDGTSAAAHVATTPVEGRIIAQHFAARALAIRELQAKVGTGADTPASGEFFKGTGAGTSAWAPLTSAEVTTALAGAAVLANGSVPLTGALTWPKVTIGETSPLKIYDTLSVETIRVASDGRMWMDYASGFPEYNAKLHIASVTANAAPVKGMHVEFKVAGAQTPSDYDTGFVAFMRDGPSVTQKTITAATNATPIVITATSHGYVTGDEVGVYNVLGNTAANGYWVVTRIDADSFSLDTSVGNGAYISGGIATNRRSMISFGATVRPLVSRDSMGAGPTIHGDDVVGYSAFNASPNQSRATDAFYLGRNPAFSGSEWVTGFTLDANLDFGIRVNGAIAANGAGLDFSVAAIHATSPAIKFAGSQYISWPETRLQGVASGFDMTNQVPGVSTLFRTTVYRNAATANPTFIGRSANGTAASPTASAVNDVLARFAGTGYDTALVTSASGSMDIYATGTWGSGSRPTGILFNTTPSGSTTLTERLRITAAGVVNIWDGGTIAPLANVTGLKIGSATTDKLGFYGATPIVQPAGTTDLRTALINLGLYASGGASPLNLNGGALASGTHTFTDATDIVVGSTTGTKIGTATTQKIGFFNATPIVQPSNTTDLRAALINLGLYASGGASPLDLNGGAFTAGSIALADAGNIAVGTTTGTKIGTAITQKIGFWNKTPVVQPAAYTLAGASVDRSYTKEVYAPTNVVADLAFDANATSIDELADALGTLQTKFNELQDFVLTFVADMQSVGLVG